MLKGLKVSSSASKCVIYRPEHKAMGNRVELNFEVIEMQNRNIPADRAQRVGVSEQMSTILRSGIVRKIR